MSLEALAESSSDDEVVEELSNNSKKETASEPPCDAKSIVSSSRGLYLEPLYVLDKAFQKVKSPGSSTVLVGILNKNMLHMINLGDSGFRRYSQQDCVVSNQRSMISNNFEQV